MAEGDWLGSVISQISPRVGELFSSTLTKQVEPLIQKVLSKSPFASGGSSASSLFRFDSISFGSEFPKCEAMETHRAKGKAKSITIDFLFTYAGDCDIQVSLLGVGSGVRDVQIQGRARVTLKPTVGSLPFAGGLQFCFLETPRISFAFDGLAGSVADLPGVMGLIKKNLRKDMAEKCVYPNKVIIPLSQSCDAMAVKCLEPRGILFVHLNGASNLPSKGGMRKLIGQSDPDGYAKVSFGASESVTTVVKNTTEPTWDQWFEFPVETLIGHSVEIDVFDEDSFSKDEFMGRARIPISAIVDEGLRMEVTTPLTAVEGIMEEQAAGGGDVQGEMIGAGMDFLSGMLETKNPAATERTVVPSDIQISAEIFYRHLSNEPSDEERLFEQQSLVLASIFIYSCNNLVTFADGTSCDGALPSAQVTVQLGSHPMKQTIVMETSEHPSFQEGFLFLLDEGWEDDVLSVMVEDTASGQSFGDVSYPISDLASQEGTTGGEYPSPVVGFHRKCISLSPDNPHVTITMTATLQYLTSTPPPPGEEEAWSQDGGTKRGGGEAGGEDPPPAPDGGGGKQVQMKDIQELGGALSGMLGFGSGKPLSFW